MEEDWLVDSLLGFSSIIGSSRLDVMVGMERPLVADWLEELASRVGIGCLSAGLRNWANTLLSMRELGRLFIFKVADCAGTTVNEWSGLGTGVGCVCCGGVPTLGSMAALSMVIVRLGCASGGSGGRSGAAVPCCLRWKRLGAFPSVFSFPVGRL